MNANYDILTSEKKETVPLCMKHFFETLTAFGDYNKTSKNGHKRIIRLYETDKPCRDCVKGGDANAQVK